MEILLELLNDAFQVFFQALESRLKLFCIRQLDCVGAFVVRDPDLIYGTGVEDLSRYLGALVSRWGSVLLDQLFQSSLVSLHHLNWIICLGQKVPLLGENLKVLITQQLLEVLFVLLLDIFYSKMVSVDLLVMNPLHNSY